MRALLLALLLLAPAALAQSSSLTASIEGPTSVTLDPMKANHRFLLNVTNHGPTADYVTVPRTDIRWKEAGQTSAGFASPEYGLALAPGASGQMFVQVEWPGTAPGTRTILLPLRSEATGQTTTLEATVTMPAEPTASARLVLVAEDNAGHPFSATFEVAQRGRTRPVDARPDPSGRAVAQVQPGEYLVHAEAQGFAGATRLVQAAAGENEVRLRLPPARHAARLVGMTNASVGDSAWTLGASSDLSLLVTSPMVHNERNVPGAFVGVGPDGAVKWRSTFPALHYPNDLASGFQGSDVTVAVSPNGSRVAGIDWNGRLHVLDGATGNELWATDGPAEPNPLYPSDSPFRQGFFAAGATAFSPDGKLLAAGGGNGWLALYRSEDGAPVWTRALGGEHRALRFTPDGKRIVVGGGDWTLRMVDATDGADVWTAPTQFWPFFNLGMDANGTRVAEGGKDSVVRLFDAADGHVILSLDAFPAFVTSTSLAADGKALTYASWPRGVTRVDEKGAVSWYRAWPGAVAASTPDLAYTLVGWSLEGRDGGFALLDDAGTTLWTAPPDAIRASCTSTLSPFPALQVKSVHLRYVDADTLDGAAACIGGGVFRVRFDVTTLAAPTQGGGTTTTTTTTTLATTSPTTDATGGTSTTTTTTPTNGSATTGTNGTPMPLAVALVGLAVAAFARRRR